MVMPTRNTINATRRAAVAKATGVDIDTARKQMVESQGGFATGRFNRPDEVADLVLLLASDRAGNVTGSDFSGYLKLGAEALKEKVRQPLVILA